MLNIGNGWDEILKDEFGKDYFSKLQVFLQEEYAANTVYPPAEHIFNAFKYTSYDEVKAVILGQDPYHEPGQAHGLAFSVPPGVPHPPSLRNMLKERDDDLAASRDNGTAAPAGAEEGVLVPWAKQGVLLLNTVLTVREHEAGSHAGQGWEIFTDAVIKKLAAREKPLVFLLWGAPAGRKKELILEEAAKTGVKHLIITAPHPSPLSAYRGYFGGRYYSRTNYFLEDTGQRAIDWRVLH